MSHPSSTKPAPTSSPDVEHVAWSTFLERFDWRQGEHVSLVGPTGCGKTTLALAILPLRRHVVAFGSKPRDSTLDGLLDDGYRKLKTWTPRPGEQRVVLWPYLDATPEGMANQRDVFVHAFRDIFHTGCWCVYIDEARYFVDVLKLAPYLRLYWYQGRALDVSLVTTTQRPAYMPLELYDAATHLFLWRENDRVNLTRLGGIAGQDGSGLDARQVARVVATLPAHDFLYVNTRTGAMLRSRVTEGS